MKMIRKQIYVEQAQDEKVKRLAESLGVTEAEVIRRAIASLSAETRESTEIYKTPIADDRRRIKEAAVLYRTDIDAALADNIIEERARIDDDAWQEELAFIEARATALATGGSTVTWRREDSYDDRRSRLSD